MNYFVSISSGNLHCIEWLGNFNYVFVNVKVLSPNHHLVEFSSPKCLKKTDLLSCEFSPVSKPSMNRTNLKLHWYEGVPPVVVSPAKSPVIHQIVLSFCHFHVSLLKSWFRNLFSLFIYYIVTIMHLNRIFIAFFWIYWITDR